VFGGLAIAAYGGQLLSVGLGTITGVQVCCCLLLLLLLLLSDVSACPPCYAQLMGITVM